MRSRERQLELSQRYHSDWPVKLTTTTTTLAEEYDPKDPTTTLEASAVDVEGTMRPRI